MKMILELRHTTLRDLEKGSLGFIAFRAARHLAIGTTREGDPQPSAVLLPLSPDEKPRVYRLDMRDSVACLNYGADWVLEYEISAVRWAGDASAYETFGALHLTKDGPVLTAMATDPRGFDRVAYINLLSAEYVEWPQNAWPVTKWAIWSSAAARSERRSKPLLQTDVTDGVL